MQSWILILDFGLDRYRWVKRNNKPNFAFIDEEILQFWKINWFWNWLYLLIDYISCAFWTFFFPIIKFHDRDFLWSFTKKYFLLDEIFSELNGRPCHSFTWDYLMPISACHHQLLMRDQLWYAAKITCHMWD